MGGGGLQLARQHNLLCSYVSNGNAHRGTGVHPPWMELYKIDLKSFRDKNYRKLGGTLEAVLDTIRRQTDGAVAGDRYSGGSQTE